MLENFLFCLKDKLNHEQLFNMFKYLSDKGFKYNIYDKGYWHFSLNDCMVEWGEDEPELYTETNLLKLDGIAKVCSISDNFTIDFDYKLIQPYIRLSYGEDEENIELTGTKLLYSIDSHNSPDNNNLGMSFGLRGFNNKKEVDILNLLETLEGLCEILNPICANVSGVNISFFEYEDLKFIPSYLEDIFFLGKDIINKIGQSVLEKAKKNVEYYSDLKNGGTFFVYSKERVIKNEIFEIFLDDDKLTSNIILNEYKKSINFKSKSNI